MAKNHQKSNKEARKPKAEKVKTIAANASTKDNPVAMVTIRKEPLCSYNSGHSTPSGSYRWQPIVGASD